MIAILGILTAIAVPKLSGFRSKAEESVCDANLNTLIRMYSVFLVEYDIDHEDGIFNQFLTENFDEISPVSGVISYVDGEVRCSMHEDRSESDEDEGPRDEVPWMRCSD